MVINLFDIISKEELDTKIIAAGLRPDPPDDIDFSSVQKRSFTTSEIKRIIDHTVLRADAGSEEVRKLCLEAAEYGFASVCINPSWVSFCKGLLGKTSVKVCTVIGFPLGAVETSVKRYEAEQAVNGGAEEVDMVINIGRLKDRDYDYVYKDIESVVEAAKQNNAVTKVIIETCYLTLEEKIAASILSKKAGAEYIKTSTGFGTSGANAADVALMKYIAGKGMKVKAAGGIRTKEDALIMMSCGAERLGTSSGVKIINEK